MKKYYINDKFEFFDEKTENHVLYAEVEELNEQITITLATLSHWFEEKIIDAAKKKWSAKEIEIKFRGDVYMGYHTFRYFKLKFFK